jgi:hypothetical protein
MPNSKTYLRSCKKCKNTFEAKTRRSPYCNECKSCKSCGKEISAISTSGYCASCKPAKQVVDHFYDTSFGFYLINSIKRYGTFEALPRDLDNLDALLEMYDTQKSIQPLSYGKLDKDNCFHICHLTPKFTSRGIAPLWGYNLIIGPSKINQKLGDEDYGYNFITPTVKLNPSYEFDDGLTHKQLMKGLYSYWPEIKDWVKDKKLPTRSKARCKGFNRVRGDYHVVLVSEIKRLISSGRHGDNLPLFRGLLENLSNVSWEELQKKDCERYGYWSELTESDLCPAIQYLAERVCQALLTKDTTSIEFAIPFDRDRYRSSSYSWFEEEKIVNDREW